LMARDLARGACVGYPSSVEAAVTRFEIARLCWKVSPCIFIDYRPHAAQHVCLLPINCSWYRRHQQRRIMRRLMESSECDVSIFRTNVASAVGAVVSSVPVPVLTAPMVVGVVMNLTPPLLRQYKSLAVAPAVERMRYRQQEGHPHAHPNEHPHASPNLPAKGLRATSACCVVAMQLGSLGA
jgi:hypothetical protein